MQITAIPADTSVNERFRWHVVQCLGGQEHLADQQLKRRGRKTFFPRAEKTVLHARKRDTLLKPLYPTYLFVFFDPKDLSWGEILHVPGVWTILGITRPMGRPKHLSDVTGANWTPYIGQPRPLREGVVDWIMGQLEQTEEGIFIMREPTETEGPALAKDTRVIITEERNAFCGFEGLVDIHEGTRVRVLLDIFGRKTPLIVQRESVAPVVAL